MVDKKEIPTDGAIGSIAKKLALSRNLVFGISVNCDSSLVYSAHRHYSTFENSHTEILSKLFPQPSIDLNDEESRKRQKREEEEEKAEFERSWRRTKLGLIAFGMGGLLLSFWAKQTTAAG